MEHVVNKYYKNTHIHTNTKTHTHIYTYTNTYKHTHTHTHTHTNTHTHKHTHIHTHTHKHTDIHTYTHKTHTHIYTRARAHTHKTHTYTHTNTYTHKHTHIHTQTHTHTHTHTPRTHTLPVLCISSYLAWEANHFSGSQYIALSLAQTHTHTHTHTHFIEPKSSLLSSQQPGTFTCLEPEESSAGYPVFFNDRSAVTVTRKLDFASFADPSVFTASAWYINICLSSVVRATSPLLSDIVLIFFCLKNIWGGVKFMTLPVRHF